MTAKSIKICMFTKIPVSISLDTVLKLYFCKISKFRCDKTRQKETSRPMVGIRPNPFSQLVCVFEIVSIVSRHNFLKVTVGFKT